MYFCFKKVLLSVFLIVSSFFEPCQGVVSFSIQGSLGLPCGFPAAKWVSNCYRPESIFPTVKIPLVLFGVGTSMTHKDYSKMATTITQDTNSVVCVVDYQYSCPFKKYNNYKSAIKDIINTINFVSPGLFQIDLTKIIVGGHSSGGQHAVMFVRDFPDIITSCIVYDPVYNSDIGDPTPVSLDLKKPVFIIGPNANPPTCVAPIGPSVTDLNNGLWFYQTIQKNVAYVRFSHDVEHNSIIDSKPFTCGSHNNQQPQLNIPYDSGKLMSAFILHWPNVVWPIVVNSIESINSKYTKKLDHDNVLNCKLSI
jgi:hypothetical protein